MRKTLAGLILLCLAITPALAHHSFAMYDMTKTQTYTGKLTRYIPGSNHAQLIFELLDNTGKTIMKDGKAVQWGVETAAAAQLARQGVTVESFPIGTIFTVNLHPLRDGRTFGAMEGAIIKCGKVMPAGGCNDKTGQVMRGN